MPRYDGTTCSGNTTRSLGVSKVLQVPQGVPFWLGHAVMRTSAINVTIPEGLDIDRNYEVTLTWDNAEAHFWRLKGSARVMIRSAF